MVGNIVGQRYRLIHTLGQGSRATVYLSRAEDTGEVFAVKVFGSPAVPLEVLRQFSQELKRAASGWQSIDEPHVTSVLDFGWDQHADAPFLVTEYIPGCTVAALIKHTPLLPVPVGLGIGYQVALGLAGAHEKDVAHGNLQPHQVFITPQGVIKLTDFGLARVAEACDWSSSDLWPPDAWLFYVTAEQFIGRDTVGDVYALGSLLYHLLIGAVPLADHDLASLPQAIQSMGPDLMTAARPGVPAEVDELVRRCMGRSLAADAGAIKPTEVAEAIRSLSTVQPATEAEIAEAVRPVLTIEQAVLESASKGSGASLFVVQQDCRVVLDHPAVMLGRHDPNAQIFPDIDLVDLDPKRVLHRQHAEVYREGSEWFIRAFHRDTRLQVNGSAVKYGKSRSLCHGDQITLSGLVDLIFEIGQLARAL